jgi:hypothetical protein
VNRYDVIVIGGGAPGRALHRWAGCGIPPQRLVQTGLCAEGFHKMADVTNAEELSSSWRLHSTNLLSI